MSNRTFNAMVLAVAAFGCSRTGSSVSTASGTTSLPTQVLTAASTNDDALKKSNDAPASSASSIAVATPAWPSLPDQELKLTWAVYPPKGHGESTRRKLELVARKGKVAHRIDLGTPAGALLPSNQAVCGDKQIAYKKTGQEIAKITFYVGGAETFAVVRSNPGQLDVVSIQGADGYCPSNDCETRKTLASFAIPTDARITEAILDIEGPGKENPFQCN
jgi:hypothetical protein